MFGSQKPYSNDELKAQLEVYKALADYLDDPVFLTHREWDGVDFHHSVCKALDGVADYISTRGLHIGYKGENYPRLQEVIDIYKCYSEAVLLGLKGKRSAAYKLFEEKIHDTLRFPFSTFRSLPGDPRFDRDNILSGYRIRTGSDSYNSNFDRADLFHIPFQLNHLIGNNRFSLSGFPCLYLSSSAYGAWEELNRPDIDHCFVSKFDMTKLSFIDISITPDEMSKRLKSHIEFLDKQKGDVPAELVEAFEHYLTDYLFLWPVILCCSFKVKNNSVFKPEYIFPQLVLEWLVSCEPSFYDGIKFLSTKTLALDGHVDTEINSLAKNYVVPARQYTNSGFCSEYVNKIEFTKPVNYAFHALVAPNYQSSAVHNEYKSTVFGILESLLENEPLGKVENQN
ncbi:hypothetical protein JKJ11_18185 [Vibrio sp. SCSIO 43133]|uniref:hypothetical protein n=1 Tax=Vibrio sp. SCSIO 43133 TaxID=2802577 RepID=UPI002074CD15|nr:hypothetical protein [Vibrio sp. SCSIO 43133]USE03345.1 hypothetical protein JKJ11_18185 [Vibrio sp. SCSIO 43133]